MCIPHLSQPHGFKVPSLQEEKERSNCNKKLTSCMSHQVVAECKIVIVGDPDGKVAESRRSKTWCSQGLRRSILVLIQLKKASSDRTVQGDPNPSALD